MATFYIGNKKVMGGGVGSVAAASTAANSNALGGVSYKNILERYRTTENNLSSPGWYRIGVFKGNNNNVGKCGLIAIDRSYYSSYPESYIFAISVSYNKGYHITQLSGSYTDDTDNYRHIINKLRLLMGIDGAIYIDMYYGGVARNTVGITTIGAIEALTPSESVIPDGYTASAEFSTVKGFKTMT